MTAAADIVDPAAETLQRLVGAHERMIALCEKIATAKAEAEPQLALEAVDRVESLAKGVRLCLALDERIRSGRVAAAKVRAEAADNAVRAEKTRRRRYIQDTLTREHLREHDYEGDTYRDLDRLLNRLDADGTLLQGDLLAALRRAANFLGVPLPMGIEDDAQELAEQVSAADPKSPLTLAGRGLGVGESARSQEVRTPTPTPPRKGEGLTLARAAALADSS